MPHSDPRVLGLISDTHGLVRPSVHHALQGVELILHAGDVGGSAILDELRLIAPVKAVFGNTDPPGELGLTEEIVIGINGLRSSRRMMEGSSSIPGRRDRGDSASPRPLEN